MASKDPARRDVARRQGELLKAARSRAGLTQEQLADVANMDRAQVIRHEAGENGMTLRSQERYLRALRLPAGYFAPPASRQVGHLPEQVAELLDEVNRLIELTTQLADRVGQLERRSGQRPA